MPFYGMVKRSVTYPGPKRLKGQGFISYFANRDNHLSSVPGFTDLLFEMPALKEEEQEGSLRILSKAVKNGEDQKLMILSHNDI